MLALTPAKTDKAGDQPRQQLLETEIYLGRLIRGWVAQTNAISSTERQLERREHKSKSHIQVAHSTDYDQSYRCGRTGRCYRSGDTNGVEARAEILC